MNHLLCHHLTHSGHLGLSVLLVEIHCLRNKDALFNVLNDVENNGSYEFGGVKVDINPITADQTGTLAEYLPQVEKYLNEKKADLSIGESNSTPKRKGR